MAGNETEEPSKGLARVDPPSMNSMIIMPLQHNNYVSTLLDRHNSNTASAASSIHALAGCDANLHIGARWTASGLWHEFEHASHPRRVLSCAT